MPLIRLKKATPGNIVLIDFSSKHEIGKSSEKRVNPLRQIVATDDNLVVLNICGVILIHNIRLYIDVVYFKIQVDDT